MRVLLTVPDHLRDKPPKYRGDWIAYHGQSGEVIAGAGQGAWVRFDNQKPHEYTGCPLEHLTPIN